MPRISIDFNRDEFSRLSDRAFSELRHPRDEARMLVRDGLGLPRPVSSPNGAPTPPVRPLTPPDRREGSPDGA
jgi:hypothetical protein